MKLLLLTLFIFSAPQLFGYMMEVKQVGKMIKTKGNGKVTISRNWGARHVKGGRNKDLFSEDGIYTDRKSKAYLKLKDGSKIIVAKGSKLKIIDEKNIYQKGGSNSYDINERPQGSKLKIITDFANINIKGTRFNVVDYKKTKVIALHEGTLEIDFKERLKRLFQVDPQCGELPSIDQQAGGIILHEGEILKFEGSNIYKTCDKSHKPLENTITIIYKNGDHQHTCATMYGDFQTDGKSSPKIDAVPQGCYLNASTEYEVCKKLISFNAEPTKTIIDDGKLELLLIPRKKQHDALFQYQCEK